MIKTDPWDPIMSHSRKMTKDSEEREGIEPSDAATTKESAIQVILPDGTPLRADDQGNYLTDDGKIIRKDDDGHFVDEQNNVLPTNDQGQAVFVEPAVTTSRPRIEIVDKETGELLPTQEDGTVLDIHGQPISTDSSGHPLSKSGEPLPTRSDGKYFYESVALFNKMKNDEVLFNMDKSTTAMFNKTSDICYFTPGIQSQN
ncbi:hypothetical protein WR25_08952 [Diploscapter pachys]|uniref:Uncharacterized protein n=1 Tax=Diploscapter pachys TaxID=2018661 RepID=A0A2A2J1L5_9BILA|nr:hypothetical protein WR25_08952 [Diploscapter pachys]